jgi:hypothetical protein
MGYVNDATITKTMQESDYYGVLWTPGGRFYLWARRVEDRPVSTHTQARVFRGLV